MYEANRPPKMTTSEASTHQTAKRPVGMVVALRVVAIGFAMSVQLIHRRCRDASGGFVLRPVVVVAIGRAVLVRTAVAVG
jgi:hypothetical protein